MKLTPRKFSVTDFRLCSYRNIAALTAACLFLTAPGCGKKEEGGAGPSPGGGSGKKLKLAFVTNNSSDFWTIARAGCQDAEKALGNVQVDFRIPSTGGTAEQQQILDDLLAKGV